jgi:hypothetical protein
MSAIHSTIPRSLAKTSTICCIALPDYGVSRQIDGKSNCCQTSLTCVNLATVNFPAVSGQFPELPDAG